MNRLAGVFWNREQRRLRSLWRLILQAAIMVVLLYVLALATYPASENPSAEFPINLAERAAQIVAVWIGCRLLDRRRMTDLGLKIDRAWLLDCAFGTALGLVLIGLVVCAGVAAGWFEVRGSAQSAGGIAIALLSAVVLVAFVAVSEELLCRGYQLRNIAEGLRGRFFGPRAAVVIAAIVVSAIFAALHRGAPALAVLSLFLAGILLATGFIFTGRIGLPLGLHFAWNLAQGNLFGLSVSGHSIEDSLFSASDSGPAFWTGGDFGPEGGLLGVIAVVLGIALTLAWIRVRYGRLRIETSLAEYRRSTRD